MRNHYEPAVADLASLLNLAHWRETSQKAADNAGMPMDYVIGGMDRSFRLKLFHMLHAGEEALLSPRHNQALRHDHRQSTASGLRAATDRSYHGGSFRGDYGHGLAADVASVKGGTRAERSISSEIPREGIWNRPAPNSMA